MWPSSSIKLLASVLTINPYPHICLVNQGIFQPKAMSTTILTYVCIRFYLVADQPFEKWKSKSTPGIHLGMCTIHARAVALLFRLLTGRVSSKLHVAFDTSFVSINGCDVNLAPPRYLQHKLGSIKGNKSMFGHSEQHDPSSTFISLSDQC